MSGLGGFDRYGDCQGNVSPNWYSRPPAAFNLLDHGSFEDGATAPIPGQPWVPNGGAAVNVLTGGFAGAKFLQTSTIGAGSVYQSIPLSIAPGETYAFTIWARVRAGYSGGTAGTLRLKALGGPQLEWKDEAIVVTTSWSLISTSVDMLYDHTSLYAEVLLNSVLPIDIDATEVVQLMDKKASFENGDSVGPAGWSLNPASGVIGYGYKCDTGGASGACYLEASKNNTNPASIYQDISTIPSPGDSFQFTAWLRQGSFPGASLSGSIVLWALGGTQESAVTYFALPDTAWRQWSVTLEPVNSGDTKLRAEIYLDTGPTRYYQIDGTWLFNNQLQHTSFETGASPAWQVSNVGYQVEQVTDAKDAAKQLRMYALTSAGGFLYHDWPVEVNAQDSLTFSVWARCKSTCPAGNPIGGALIIYGLASEQYYTYFNLTSTSQWVPIVASLDVATAGTPRQARIVVYPQGREIAVDAVSNSAGSGG